MPYKRKGRKVYVKRGGRWVLLKTMESVRKAEKYLQALRINVRH